VCIDKSSAFRSHPEVPLVVPEVNGGLLEKNSFQNIVSSPNCVAIPLALVLKPLNVHFGISRVIVSTYQSVSGAGWQSVEKFAGEIEESPLKSVGDLFEAKINSWQTPPLAYNVIPQIGPLDENDDSDEERKVRQETLRLLQNPEIQLALTCVRVPTWIGHSLSINVEFKKPFSSVSAVQKALQNQPGISVSETPTTPYEAQGKKDVFVSRVRPCAPFGTNTGVSLWATTDNLMKGAALNALQIL
jgi:aspartate-semialdehyde dehydrogenase